MGLDAKDIPITREQAQAWVWEYDLTHKNDSKLRDFLLAKVDALSLGDVMVDTTQRDDYPQNEVHVVDLLMDDLSSYARAEKPTA